ncbi:hypothetical protein [Deinococcus soli (ex Cha et al. 2016)]|uniref:Uncharacterized protein n=1 Tax=Deinococcus soli (ex Cha et al. 2016) TaxID=1309411 RepID=A0A0F7JLS0_9DEIO|nr:hypothetical protein [Deinococcus soli (ex Cha et al. 2016)]AKH16582.1 hypothetical protein SY84_05400 [Deinococcus soli (ex Cha et al. 2016)]
MTPFKRALTQATARYGRFSHAAHPHVAWHLLRERPALTALAEFRSGLRDLADRMGLQAKYSETQTAAWFFVVLDHLDRTHPDCTETWDAFEARCPHLFNPAYLHAFYPPDVLNSPAARTHFLPPDRQDT